MKTNSWIKFAVLVFISLVLSACGGGSDSGEGSTADAVLVNAGANISLNEAQTANITGGASGGTGALTYAWQADASVIITHDDTTLADAVITAPSVTEISAYTISLTATDESGSSGSNSFVLTVNPVNIAPTSVITSNDISGYASNTYPVTSAIVLDGTNSSDQDPQTATSPITAYLWQQVAGPSLLAGINSSADTITLVAPTLSTSQTAVIRLTVTDQELATASSDITITLLAENETLPEATISLIRDVFAGEIQALSGEGQSIAPSASPFSATWTNSSTASINDVNEFNTYAIAPLVSEDTEVRYALSVEDSFGNTASTQLSAMVYAPIVRTVNDTGVQVFANEASVFSAYQADFAGQDADFGADQQSQSGQVSKVGDGEAGFDFTRLDNNGDIIDNPSFEFTCVRDNTTGLIWQTKTASDTSSSAYVEQTFTWYAEEDNGNFEGSLNEASTSCNVSSGQCNTQAYLDQVNAEGMCGFFDWRLPNIREMQSIVHYGKTSSPLVDTEFFPYWGTANNSTLWYWTSQSSADGVSDDTAYNAWALDMNSGNDGFLDKTTEQRVILVRAGR
ncbi:DUF1566 domain-containing protein [Glaciecola sp. 2405UD65-10]|uniref:Lcl C-terminal domain-containing protein n=1 Tax=Glaciecola sp. 2405UD65-10 TaxID=3397244 RepID=UPI003B5B96E9